MAESQSLDLDSYTVDKGSLGLCLLAATQGELGKELPLSPSLHSLFPSEWGLLSCGGCLASAWAHCRASGWSHGVACFRCLPVVGPPPCLLLLVPGLERARPLLRAAGWEADLAPVSSFPGSGWHVGPSGSSGLEPELCFSTCPLCQAPVGGSFLSCTCPGRQAQDGARPAPALLGTCYRV